MSKKGFTIVELVVVIAVIAILAAIVIVTYNNATRNARIDGLKADLQAASGQLEQHRNFANSFPATMNETNGGRGLPKGDNTNYTYSYDATEDRYCLAATSTYGGIPTYHIASEGDTSPTEGVCPAF